MLSNPNNIRQFSVSKRIMDIHKSTEVIELFHLICIMIFVKSVLTLEEIRMETNIYLPPRKMEEEGYNGYLWLVE